MDGIYTWANIRIEKFTRVFRLEVQYSGSSIQQFLEKSYTIQLFKKRTTITQTILYPIKFIISMKSQIYHKLARRFALNLEETSNYY